MTRFTRIIVPLGKDEFQALRELSAREYRHPRDQARYLLRQALGLTDGETGPTSPTHNASSATVKAGNRPGGAAG